MGSSDDQSPIDENLMVTNYDTMVFNQDTMVVNKYDDIGEKIHSCFETA